jgi:TupA-like ATPgrasp
MTETQTGLQGNLMTHERTLAMRYASWITSKATHALPDVWFYRVNYLMRTRRVLHLKDPRSYSEKIQWMKLHGGLERYAPYVDKCEIRQYVENIVGAQYLVPLIGVWADFDEIPFEELPDQFVLKATHGQGYNFICRDRSDLDLGSLRATVANWMNRDFYRSEREPQYRNIRPRLIVEAYLEDDSGALRDYKFPCFAGVPYVVQVLGDRADGTTENIYDREWHLLPVVEKGYPNTPEPVEKPELLDEMLSIAAKLSAGFPFVRVDLYSSAGRVYFGELTFTPASGIITYEPGTFDLELGGMLDLSKFRVPSGS